ncbi:histidine--tRNA ligase [Ornithinimicrobium pekingense]|uniref:Histidine--tRNA ligase n=1 Tax=Ornithinimicrobium pekingense TaxID=384677 RepID=A0ABQ2FA52_9MICO|nr:histidine--tRNA ligase [Ornithinimicrobium pekingense]GGK76303.1 histidine--tRNA ligase [Ornithinimicrobium pekingense]
MITPRTPSGVLELLPAEQIAFQRMLDAIRSGYERFGFLPIETPVFERSDVLLTKTGGETERQVYFVQSTGALEKSREADTSAEGPALPEMALRFDLTVPLARYVAEHEHQLTFPFRRYQMQRVYRGERPQRGRFREFYQCDVDIIGKDELSVRHDAECPAIIHAIFTDLAIGSFTIQVNNRKLLRGFYEDLGITDAEQQAAVLREVDKLDKRGPDHLRSTLTGAGFGLADEVVEQILAFVQVRSTGHDDALARLAEVERGSRGSASLAEGVAELREVLTLVRALGVPESDYCLNFSIARGLDYYTGTVYETTLDEHPQIGSICSGGRYDNLAGQYTRSRLPGVGISIGLSRLFWQLREAGLLEASTGESTVQALVPQVDAELLDDQLALASQLRHGGINTEAVLDGGKLGKQLRYADRAGIRFVAILGRQEVADGTVTLKDLRRQDQFTVPRTEVVSALRVELAQPQV